MMRRPRLRLCRYDCVCVWGGGGAWVLVTRSLRAVAVWCIGLLEAIVAACVSITVFARETLLIVSLGWRVYVVPSTGLVQKCKLTVQILRDCLLVSLYPASSPWVRGLPARSFGRNLEPGQAPVCEACDHGAPPKVPLLHARPSVAPRIIT
jgi:hypothetical protein